MADPRTGNITRPRWTYPSPWLDIASTWLPKSFTELYKWCRYYFYSNSNVNVVITKIASYALTEIYYKYNNTEVSKSDDEKTKKILFKVLKLKKFVIGVLLDYFVYGNAYFSLYVPFVRKFKCPSCEKEYHDISVKYKIEGFEFTFFCPQCVKEVKSSETTDSRMYTWEKMNLVRWNVENVVVEYNPISGRNKYFYKIPLKTKADIAANKRYIIEETPLLFIDALKQNRDLEFSDDNFFHLQRPTLAEDDMGVGKGILVPLMKDLYYTSILLKAQEAIMLEHIVPFDLLFPSANSGIDPFTHTTLDKFKVWLEQEIEKWRLDNNHKSVLPFPVGTARVGGDGRALMITPEIQQQRQNVVGGTGVPYDLVYGNLVYSGGSVTQRILENFLMGLREEIFEAFDWLANKLQRLANLPEGLEIRMVDFKMADDVQKKQIITSHVQMKLLSKETASKEFGYDYKEEQKRILKETKEEAELTQMLAEANAKAQGEAGLISIKYQIEAQKVQQDMEEEEAKKKGLSIMEQTELGGYDREGGAEYQTPKEESIPEAAQQAQGLPVDWEKAARRYAEKIIIMPQDQQQSILQQISQETPNLYSLIVKVMDELTRGVDPKAATIPGTPKQTSSAPKQTSSAPKIKPGKEGQ
jgi:hypothetical protein